MESLNSNKDLKSEIESIHLNANIKNEVITLEPWCIVISNENGITFVPQLKATLRSESGKAIWEGNYGPMSKSGPFSLSDSMDSETIGALKTRLADAYGEITNQLTANIQGKHDYVSNEENRELTDKLLKNLDIKLDESLDNKQINKH